MKEEDNIEMDKLIRQNLHVEKPSSDFSIQVMQQIAITKKDKALSTLIQRNLLEKPSADFTANVMTNIDQLEKASIYIPVISKKVWVLIASLFMIVTAYTLITLDTTQSYFTRLEKYTPSFNNDLTFDLPPILTSPLFALSIFSLSALLFLDYFIRNRKLSL